MVNKAHLIFKKHLKRHASNRTRGGFTLVEVLVTILISTIISAIIFDLYCQLLRLSTTSQNNLYANTVAQEALSFSRAGSFNALTIGSHKLLLNKEGVSQEPPPMHPEPLLMDFNSKDWSSSVKQAQFKGDATAVVSASQSVPEAVNVTVTVNHFTNPSDQRSVSSSIFVSRIGLGRWTN
jgi:prepilin-type N-terminal cleavage/methylation domain-containing protein